jgi:hypothetical protein
MRWPKRDVLFAQVVFCGSLAILERLRKRKYHIHRPAGAFSGVRLNQNILFRRGETHFGKRERRARVLVQVLMLGED